MAAQMQRYVILGSVFINHCQWCNLKYSTYCISNYYEFLTVNY